MLAALLLSVILPPALPHAPAPAMNLAKIAPMDDARFWDIVAGSAAPGADREAQVARLRAILRSLSVADLEAYQAAYDVRLAQSYSWDLWGAAYVIGGGASDDGFDDFRDWLIAQGRAVFEAAVADPDRLATLIPTDAYGPLEFGEFGRVGPGVWAERTGRPVSDMPMNAQPTQPSGTQWAEDAATLSKRYPRLWHRFGAAPLG